MFLRVGRKLEVEFSHLWRVISTIPTHRGGGGGGGGGGGKGALKAKNKLPFGDLW